MRFLKLTVIFSVILLGGCLVLGLYLHAWENNRNKGTNTITVTGSAKQNVEADLAKWTANFTRQAKADNLKEILELSKSDLPKIKEFVTAYQIDEKSITFIPLQTDVVYEYRSDIGYTQNVSGYNIRQKVIVESNDIAKIEKLAQEASKLIDLGIVPEYQATEYYYTKLDDLRPTLFAQATKDAQTRAIAIASGTGAQVGNLRTAKTGVIQVLAPNSVDISDYGTYDTSTKQKVITATVSVSFELK
jgi:hypothetical protein